MRVVNGWLFLVTLAAALPSVASDGTSRLSPGIAAPVAVPAGDVERKPLLFEFGPGVSGKLTVEAVSTTVDTLLRVWRQAPDGGVVLVGEDEDSGTGPNSRLVFDAVAEDLYRIEVRPASISWCGGTMETSWHPGAPVAIDDDAAQAAEEAYWHEAEQASAGNPVCDVEARLLRLSIPDEADPRERLALAEQAVGRAQEVVGSNHPLFARGLWVLGLAQAAAMLKQESVATLERADAILKAGLGRDHPARLAILDALGDTLAKVDVPVRTKQVREEAVAVAEKALGPTHTGVAKALHELALHHWRLSEFAAARPLLERSRAILEQAYGPENANVAVSTYVLAMVLRDQGDPNAARPLFERALAIDERLSGPNSSVVAERLSGLGIFHLQVGDTETAVKVLERSLRICENLGNVPDRCGQQYYNLGLVYTELGDFERGRATYEKALELDRQVSGPEHSYVADDLMKLSRVERELGNLEEAIALAERALAIHEKVFGPTSLRIAETLDTLASAVLNNGDLPRARALYEREIRIMEAAEGPHHTDLPFPLSNLANLADLQGHREEAKTLRTRSIAIGERVGMTLVVAGTRVDMADSAMAAGDLAAARDLLEQALPSLTKTRGESHPDVARALAMLAQIRWGLGEPGPAFDLALRASEVAREHTQLVVRSLPERQAIRYGVLRREGLDAVLSMALTPGAPPDAARRAWNAVIRARALVLDEMSARHRSVIASDDPETLALAQYLGETSRKLATLVMRSEEGEPALARLRELRMEKEKTERSLTARNAAFRDAMAQRRFGLSDLADGAGEGTALVAYFQYVRRGWTAAHKPTAVPALAAFVLEASGHTVSLVPIATQEELDPLVSRWRGEASAGALRPERSQIAAVAAYRKAGDALRRKVWDPLVPCLGQPTRILVVPDGALQLVAFGALPGESGSFLLEDLPPLHYLSAERDLAPRTSGEAEGNEALVVGNPAFDDGSSFAALTPAPRAGAAPLVAGLVPPAFRGTRSSCARFTDLRFDALPAAGREAADVAAAWPGETVRLEGAAATEGAFKARSRGKHVLHLATHGWILGGACVAAPSTARGVTGLAGPNTPPLPVTAENPLLLSGLAFAGANRRGSAGPDEDDGILTAEEIAALDLSHVEWAVLSACDTGLGEIKAGEGVFGLRRAFQVAGARTLIMSLWSVEDESARAWMNSLYTARLQEHLDTASSVRAASLAVLTERRAKKQSTHPFYWAGFVAAGDWR